MIRYPVSREELEARIEALAPGWLDKAAKRTADFRKLGFYQEGSSIWSDIKQVFMEVQACKCVFCERKLEGVELGKIEHDVEHFRPKSRITRWEASKELIEQGIKFAAVPDEERGYYLLPYNIFNYATSCKTCNSILKKDFFPIAGSYRLEGEDPKELSKEKPLLIYPIGDIDNDPEKLIKFHGVSPQAVSKRGYARARALVTIEFFGLDDEARRKILFSGRARVIVILYPQLLEVADGNNEGRKRTAEKLIEGFTSHRSEHSGCARCFKKLFESDRGEAEAIYDRATEYLISIS